MKTTSNVLKTTSNVKNKNSKTPTGWSVKNKRINLTEIQQKAKENPQQKTITMERNDYNKLNITLEDENNTHLSFDETMNGTIIFFSLSIYNQRI